MVSLNVSVAVRAMPLLAVIVKLYGTSPAVPAAGVPLMVAVPLPLAMKVTPPGRVPLSVRAAAGKPVVAIVTLLTWPVVKTTAVGPTKAAGRGTL